MSLLRTLKFIANHPLNRERKLESMIRFARWQIGSRLVSSPVVYQWVNGAKFLVKRGETGLTGNIYTGLHEFRDMGFLLHYLRADDFFVDVGANVGSYTLLACAAIGARGAAFEPVPSTYMRLVENIRLNHLDERVDCVNKGVGAGKGTLVFTSGSDTTNHALAPGERCEHAIEVEVTSLDLALHAETPSILKIDVEGYETPVLDGARSLLQDATLNAVIMELNGSGARYGFDESKILETMLANGFKTYSYDVLTRTLVSLGGKNLDSGNTIFIRDESLVLERLRSAPIVSILGRTL